MFNYSVLTASHAAQPVSLDPPADIQALLERVRLANDDDRHAAHKEAWARYKERVGEIHASEHAGHLRGQALHQAFAEASTTRDEALANATARFTAVDTFAVRARAAEAASAAARHVWEAVATDLRRLYLDLFVEENP